MINDENDRQALENLEDEKRARHVEAILALANEAEWARTHPLPDRRRTARVAYFQKRLDPAILNDAAKDQRENGGQK